MATPDTVNKVGYLNQLLPNIPAPLDGRDCTDTIANRDAIGQGLRYPGMHVFVVETGHTYRLTNGTANTDWEVVDADNIVSGSINSDSTELTFTKDSGDSFQVTGTFRGSDGISGQSATVDVGTTTTGDPGTDAMVTNSGTTSAAVLDFVIPRGERGERGPAGAGSQIAIEDDGVDVHPNQLAAFSVINFAQGISATASSSATNEVDISVDTPTEIDNLNSSSNLSFWTGTEAEYNAIANPDPNTLYTITDDDDFTFTGSGTGLTRETADGLYGTLAATNANTAKIGLPTPDTANTPSNDAGRVPTVQDDGSYVLESTTVTLRGLGVDATAIELNVLDGVMITTDQLNVLSDFEGNVAGTPAVTANTAKISLPTPDTSVNPSPDRNQIPIVQADGTYALGAQQKLSDLGVTASAAEVNTLDGITASTAELNVLDGITSSTDELNILDGVTSSTAELNILDGITATTDELNHVSGATSDIQTQLDTKAPIAGPTFTGTLTSNGPIVSNGSLTMGETLVGQSRFVGGHLAGVSAGTLVTNPGVQVGDTFDVLAQTLTISSVSGNDITWEPETVNAIFNNVDYTFNRIENITLRKNIQQLESDNAVINKRYVDDQIGTTARLNGSNTLTGTNTFNGTVGGTGFTSAVNVLITQASVGGNLDTTIMDGSTNAVQGGAIFTALAGKQDTLHVYSETVNGTMDVRLGFAAGQGTNVLNFSDDVTLPVGSTFQDSGTTYTVTSSAQFRANIFPNLANTINPSTLTFDIPNDAVIDGDLNIDNALVVSNGAGTTTVLSTGIVWPNGTLQTGPLEGIVETGRANLDLDAISAAANVTADFDAFDSAFNTATAWRDVTSLQANQLITAAGRSLLQAVSDGEEVLQTHTGGWALFRSTGQTTVGPNHAGINVELINSFGAPPADTGNSTVYRDSNSVNVRDALPTLAIEFTSQTTTFNRGITFDDGTTQTTAAPFYQTGTWTPDNQGATTGVTYGECTYTRVGNSVTLHFLANVANGATGNFLMPFTAFPFTQNAGRVGVSVASVSRGIATVGRSQESFITNSGGGRIALLDTGTQTALTFNDLAPNTAGFNDTQVRYTVTYETNA